MRAYGNAVVKAKVIEVLTFKEMMKMRQAASQYDLDPAEKVNELGSSNIEIAVWQKILIFTQK